jgi:pimeloyl-ACP methyl ester carboxylesterase
MSSSTTQKIHYETLGSGPAPVFWAHGWGHTSKNLLPMAQSLEGMGHHWVIDFPGFGDSPVPATDWSTEDYADYMANVIKSQTTEKVVWVGHSFGCRVGLQLAARHPELIGGLFLMSAAGLPRIQNPLKKLYFKGRIRLYKLLKKLVPFGLPEQWLLKKFASPDYLNAGPMKNILVKTVNENLSAVAAQVTCPVILVYGAKDQDTPPNMGERFHKLIKNSQLIVLDGFDHYSILTEARHQVVHKLNAFIKEVRKAA